MVEVNTENLNDIELEGPGGTQVTHAASLRRMRGGLETEIREHPLKSLAIALGCGYLLAKILD